MSDGREEFTDRLERVVSRHRALARGYCAKLRSDGLIELEPRRVQFKLPLRGFVLLMAFLMMFKGFMLASLGADAYSERLTVLGSGTIFEQIGALIMGIDPVSRTMADALNPFLGE